MKITKKGMLSILVLFLISILVACGNTDSKDGAEDESNDTEETQNDNEGATADESHGWGESKSGAIVNGKFDVSEDGVVTSTDGEGWHQIYKELSDAEDYTFSADIKWVETGSVAEFPKFGLIPSYEDFTNYTAAFLDKNHNVLATFATVGGTDQEWINGDLPEGFDFEVAHTLTIEKVGSEFTYYVDGEEILTRTLELGGGEIGIITEDTIAEYSNFSVE